MSVLMQSVSVIIPAYNVEKYIEECVLSVVNQTHKNIEIIVVNDGSTDKTGELINNIAKNDNRIRVIHKQNGGVSAARNSGLEIASGEYIIFLDGDDFVAPDYVEYLLGLAITTGSEFCLSKYYFTKKNELQTPKEKVEILSPQDATALLLSPVVIVGSNNKIYKRSFLIENEIQFPTDLFYGEGLYFTIKVAQLANKTTVGERKTYYYRKNNMVSATTQFNIEKFFNGEKSLMRINSEINIKNKKINDMFKLHLATFYLSAIAKIRANKLRKKYKSNYDQWLKYIRKSMLSLVFSKYVSLYRKLLIITGSISPWLIMKLDANKQKKKIAKSI